MSGPTAKLLLACRIQPTISVGTDAGLTRVRLVAVAWLDNKRRYIGYGHRLTHSGFNWARPELARVEWARSGGWCEISNDKEGAG